MNRVLPLVPVLVVIALAGCGSSSRSSSSATASSTSSASSGSGGSAATGGASGAATIQVAMKNLAFSPVTAQAKVGQTVQWTNQDSPPHNVSYLSGPKFASSSNLPPSGTFQLKLTQPGTIHYECSIHPFMKATIVVSK